MVLPMITIARGFDCPPSPAPGDVEATAPWLDKLEAVDADPLYLGVLRTLYWAVGEADVEVEIDGSCDVEDVVYELEERTTVVVDGAGCGVGIGVGFVGALSTDNLGAVAVVGVGKGAAVILLPCSSNVAVVRYFVCAM
jgi:hypothetical protein